jgi:hypothetical protein
MATLITTLVVETTINYWRPYLFPLMFNYNMSFLLEEQKSQCKQIFRRLPRKPEFPARNQPYSQTFPVTIGHQFWLTKEIAH